MKPHTSPIGAALSAITSAKGALAAGAAVLALGAMMVNSQTSVATAPGAAKTRALEAQAATRAPFTTTSGGAAKAADAGGFSAAQKKEIEALIRSYLLSNPEVMMEVQQALESKMEKMQAEKMAVALKQNAAEIFRAPTAPIAGNVNGDVTVVEFFDYNCGFCKKAFVDLVAAAEKDKKLKLVLKELPILSKGSEEAARVALAAKMQGKYWEFHRAMLESQSQANEASALRTAEKLGLDVAKLKVDMNSAEVKGEIERTRKLAEKLGIQGTPHFLVADKPIGGAPQGLADLIIAAAAEVRKSGGCKVC